jgi:hypothetical protein
VRDRLTQAGVIASGAGLGVPERGQVLRVFVAQWSDMRNLRSLRTLEKGPQESGVFARFDDNGARLELLDPNGGVARVAGPGMGLVAATRTRPDEAVSFIVTGVDRKGLEAAAGALEQGKLRDAFAVAVGPDGVTKLPLEGP